MDRILRVTGKGSISVKPNITMLLIDQSAIEEEYEEAIKRSSEDKEYLNIEIQKYGFKKADLKTVSFNIDIEYDRCHDDDGIWKNIFKGYSYNHRMMLEFPSDNQKLGKLLSVIAKCPGQPVFSIHYTISDSDKELAKNELLARAVEDSKIKAGILSKTSGVELKEIISIDYSWREIDFITRPVDGEVYKGCSPRSINEDSINLDIEANDINASETVTVVWRIE